MKKRSYKTYARKQIFMDKVRLTEQDSLYRIVYALKIIIIIIIIIIIRVILGYSIHLI